MDTPAADVMVFLVMVLLARPLVVLMSATIAGVVVHGGRGLTGCVAVVARL